MHDVTGTGHFCSDLSRKKNLFDVSKRCSACWCLAPANSLFAVHSVHSHSVVVHRSRDALRLILHTVYSNRMCVRACGQCELYARVGSTVWYFLGPCPTQSVPGLAPCGARDW